MSNEQEGGISKVTISVTSNGRRYDMAVGDFSALDELHFKEATGEDLMTPFLTGKINTILISGLLWLYRRRFEKNLRFEAVAAEFKFSDLDNIEWKTAGKDDPADELSRGVVDPEG